MLQKRPGPRKDQGKAPGMLTEQQHLERSWGSSYSSWTLILYLPYPWSTTLRSDVQACPFIFISGEHLLGTYYLYLANTLVIQVLAPSLRDMVAVRSALHFLKQLNQSPQGGLEV